jgi:hypothetical protein
MRNSLRLLSAFVMFAVLLLMMTSTVEVDASTRRRSRQVAPSSESTPASESGSATTTASNAGASDESEKRDLKLGSMLGKEKKEKEKPLVAPVEYKNLNSFMKKQPVLLEFYAPW